MKLSEKKRINILQAAEHLFFENGVEHTSMDQVAAKAEASKRTVYNHFATKEELFQAILTTMLAKINHGDVIYFNKNQPIDLQLTAIAEQEVAMLTSPDFLRLAKIAFMQMLQEPQLAKSLSNNTMGCMTYLEDFLEQARTAGVLKGDELNIAAKQFVYQLKSFVFYPLLYGFETITEQQNNKVIEQTVSLFLAKYKA
ncbi:MULTISPECIES: TetR/AcrR family transcriptional regulator [unclassified Pseudoalteromonas]|jgi:TetR/AcrR family transcriptional regulator of autoinduction and epiphytic fitness|uniref:TetR/AcrR family transcriptional regulator n=1 Tax=unclassified Pseudoalteromonas TaxID=194690 RepID=UPI000EE502ED|nr:MULTISPECIES: TetR/AcrR family transcriptional regulator [unclassified Pseudoalteromonas]HAG41119.1 TetR family transcriptional regulator [Pseudoalteromonas sp.]|tara:strand:- start:3811 stop:4404 length:594 start_codon:yes stop_codon:yes gene_type:complete